MAPGRKQGGTGSGGPAGSHSARPAQAITGTYKLDRGYTVDFTLAAGKITASWSPRVPYGRHARQILPAYRRARDAFLARHSADLGGAIAVVEI